VQLNEKTGEFVQRGEFKHPYPATKVMWVPDRTGTMSDLIGTTGDYLRLWEVDQNGDIQLKCLLNNVRCCLGNLVSLAFFRTKTLNFVRR